MKQKITPIILFVLLLPLAATVAIALAAGSAQNTDAAGANLQQSQSFTYQGELMDDGSPEPGPCDFQFGLWDAPSLGSQVGLTQTLSSVQLVNGRFSVVLNDNDQIGASPFSGLPVWMAIAVDCPAGTGSPIALSPRQPLTAAPYAHYSMEAGSAPWTGITSIPDGFADGLDDDTLYEAGTGLDLITTTFHLEDNYRLPQGCGSNQNVEWTGSNWGCVTPSDSGYANVIVVAKSGGDFDTIRGAINSIFDATSENRYLVWVAPGVYSETVDMMSWVDIEGAGEDLTRIESAGFTSIPFTTITASAHSELRFLTVENTGGNAFSRPLGISVDGFILRNVRIVASGGTDSDIGVSISGGTRNNIIQNCSIIVDSQLATGASYGMYVSANPGDIRLVLDNLIIEVNSSVDVDLNGILQGAGPSYTNIITATRLMIKATNSGTNDAWAFRSSGVGTKLNISDSSLNGYGTFGIGFYVTNGGTSYAQDVEMEGSHYGVRISSQSTPATVHIDGATLTGGIYSALVHSGAGHELNIGTSLLDGDYFVAPGDTMTCVNSYDENYTNVNGFDACP
jgi:hypothetical protein